MSNLFDIKHTLNIKDLFFEGMITDIECYENFDFSYEDMQELEKLFEIKLKEFANEAVRKINNQRGE